eukprot:scaffold4845_cov98-Isochrysis_galbana.AAC.4
MDPSPSTWARDGTAQPRAWAAEQPDSTRDRHGDDVVDAGGCSNARSTTQPGQLHSQSTSG